MRCRALVMSRPRPPACRTCFKPLMERGGNAASFLHAPRSCQAGRPTASESAIEVSRGFFPFVRSGPSSASSRPSSEIDGNSLQKKSRDSPSERVLTSTSASEVRIDTRSCHCGQPCLAQTNNGKSSLGYRYRVFFCQRSFDFDRLVGAVFNAG